MERPGRLTERISAACWAGLCFMMWAGCSGGDSARKPSRTAPSAQKEVALVNTPAFSADSAFDYVARQVAFGPRVPNSIGHQQCGDWLIAQLEGHGADVTVQDARVTAFDGTKLDIRNIFGAFNPNVQRRILLYAHWDTRPFADKDSVRTREPIDGANDGASGVGVLLELARIMGDSLPNIGVDIAFFDAEDYGEPEWLPNRDADYTDWCLGSQYWARRPHVPGYRAKYGILLDMVGAKGAVFNKEGTSMALAPRVVDKVWSTARKLGHGDVFRSRVTPQTIDDNLFVSQLAGIPSANIVHYHLETQMMGYFQYHHTHGDNLSAIDPEVLGKVGEVLTQVVYAE
ncbi:MAG: M28 family peptidase [Flavobacteriales bacterium]|nr:M28 family peptidase [Flavobacteriales bacterium]